MKNLITYLSALIILLSCKKESIKNSNIENDEIEVYGDKLFNTISTVIAEQNPVENYLIKDSKSMSETVIKYLGKVQNSKNQNLTLLSQIRYEGNISKKAISSIVIFEDNDKYIGYYYIPNTNDLPTRMEKGILFFENNNNDCLNKTATKINFNKEIPNKIFRTCNGNLGDLYEFTIDD